MLTPAEIKGMVDRKYPIYLRSLVTGEPMFPIRIRFGVPSTTDEFAKLRQEAGALVAGNFGYTIEYEEKNTRRYGTQRLPSQVRFDTEEQFVKALCKQREVEQFRVNLAATLARLPQLKDWMACHVKWAVEFGHIWSGMLLVCEYFLAHPRPGLYTRQLPIAVHTKFIQENSNILTSLLNTILPESAKMEGETFEARFGLKPLEPTIRFRALYPSVIQQLKMSDERMGLPLDRFRVLPAEDLRVIITENLMNLECLPPVPNGLGIWGQGNAAELLTRVDWLARCEVLYWGDIDEHGFHILARLRARYPNIRSAMMDINTLNDLRHLTGKGEKTGAPPINLTAEEWAAFDEVQRNNLRLEQEKVPFEYSLKVISRMTKEGKI